MNEITPALAVAAGRSGFRPAVVFKAGRRCPAWEEIYAGNEPEYYHAMALTSAGTLVRARITPPEDGRKLYVQSVSQPGTASDFSRWNYLNCYNLVVLAITALEQEVHLFYILADRRIERLVSHDGGLNWSGPELIDYAPTTGINGIAAAFTPGGEIGLFYADQATLYAKKYTDSAWQVRDGWPHTVGVLSGAGVVYDGDWILTVTGQDLDGGYRLWHLVYGNGLRYSPGGWSGLTELSGAPGGENFAFEHASLSRADAYRCLYDEIYFGNGAYRRTRMAVSVAEGLWAEPEAFAGDGLYGFAQAAGSGWLWAGSSRRLYRARLDEVPLDLSGDVTGFELKTGRQSSRLSLELDNSRYDYSGFTPALEPGGEIQLGLGYVTNQGAETAPLLNFELKSRKVHASRGCCRLLLEAAGGWERLEAWQARHQYRWNHMPGEATAVQILAFLLARAGMVLVSSGASPEANTLTPDFMLNPGSRGDISVTRILAMLPDRLVFEGLNGYLYNPQQAGQPCCAYSGPDGSGYPVYESGWRLDSAVYNSIQVEGEDPATSELILGTALDRQSITASGERFLAESGMPAASPEQAESRAGELLNGWLSRACGGYLRAPFNPAVQVGDVIGVDCTAVGLSGDWCRIVAVETVYEPRRGRYEQVIELESAPN